MGHTRFTQLADRQSKKVTFLVIREGHLVSAGMNFVLVARVQMITDGVVHDR